MCFVHVFKKFVTNKISIIIKSSCRFLKIIFRVKVTVILGAYFEKYESTINEWTLINKVTESNREYSVSIQTHENLILYKLLKTDLIFSKFCFTLALFLIKRFF